MSTLIMKTCLTLHTVMVEGEVETTTRTMLLSSSVFSMLTVSQLTLVTRGIQIIE